MFQDNFYKAKNQWGYIDMFAKSINSEFWAITNSNCLT